MNAFVYQVKFVGGPSDGLVFQVEPRTFQPESQLSVSIVPLAVARQRVADVSGEANSSTYQMASREFCQDNGREAVLLRYEFVPLKREDRTVASAPAAAPRNRWLAMLSKVCSRIWTRVANWMLEPIAYPLQMVGPVPRQRESAGVKQVGSA